MNASVNGYSSANKNVAIIYLLLMTMLVTVIQAKNRNAQHALDLSSYRKSSLNTKTYSQPETKTTSTSTVRPWPSHKFFKGILTQPKRKHSKAGQLSKPARSHNQTFKTTTTRPVIKRGHANKFAENETIPRNSTINKPKKGELLKAKVNKSQGKYQHNLQSNTHNPIKPVSKSKLFPTLPSKVKYQITKASDKKQNVSSVGVNKHRGSNKTSGAMKIHSKTLLPPTKIHILSTTVFPITLTTTTVKPREKVLSSYFLNEDYKVRKKYLKSHSNVHTNSKVSKPSSPLMKGSTRTIMNFSGNDSHEIVQEISPQAIPFQVTKINFTSSHTNRKKPSIPSKGEVSVIHKTDKLTKNMTLISGLKNRTSLKHRRKTTITKDNEIDSLHQWIDKDNEFSVSPYPSPNPPNFTNLKWPYHMESSTTGKTTTLRSENLGIGFQFKVTDGENIPTTTVTATSKKMDEPSGIWKLVPTVTAHPATTLPTVSLSLKYKNKNNKSKKQSIATNHWGSSGTKIMPLNHKSKPQLQSPLLTHEITTANPNVFHPNDLASHVTQQMLLSTLEPSSFTEKPQTNIWYKPVINHFTSSSNTHTTGNSLTGTSMQFPMVFKVWSYKHGKLILENEKEIPSWALQGFNVKDGAILNLDQIPEPLQALVSSALVKNAKRKKYAKDKGKPLAIDPFQGAYDDEENDNAEVISSHSAITGVSLNNGDSSAKLPVNINYVILNSISSTMPPPTFEKNDFDISSLSTPDTVMDETSPHVKTSNSFNQYIHILTTPKPLTKLKGPQRESWIKLQNLISNALINNLPTPVQHSEPPLPPPPTIQPVKHDSVPSDKSDDKELLANLAAIAILISYMRNQHPSQTITEKPTVVVNNSTSMPVNDFNTAMLQLFQQLLKRNGQSNESSQRVKVNEADPNPPQSLKEKSKTTITANQAASLPHHPDSITKTLLLKGAIKKGKKKKFKKKLFFKKKKKKKLFFKKKKFKKLGTKILHKISPLAHLLKKPKEYWFDVKFDVDIYDIMKKKFLYLLAFKYAPVFFVLALGLIPLGIVIIPLLLKILWFKKKPRYIRVPVPVPKPFPVYPPPPYHHHHHRPHPSYHHHHPHGPFHEIHDHEYAADSTGMYHEPEQNEQSPELNGPYAGNNIQDLIENDWTKGNDQSVALPNPGGIEDTTLKPLGVTHPYSLGFDLGSKLGTLTNQHDREVLRILIQSKKDKIEKLLSKWKLLHKAKSTTPVYELEDFEKIYKHKLRKRRKRKS